LRAPVQLPTHRYRLVAGFLVNTAVFVGAFTLICALIGAMLPMPEVATVSAKLAHFSRHRDDYDTLFIGSSRVYRQIDPALFDRLTSEQGIDSHSFNFGIEAMHSPEDLYLCEQILALKPARLKRVFLESSGFYHTFPNRDTESMRVVYWHDARRLFLLSKLIFSTAEKPVKPRSWEKELTAQTEKFNLFGQHLAIFFKRFCNLGQYASLFSFASEPPDRAHRMSLGPAEDGFKPLDFPFEGVELEQYKKRCLDLIRQPARKSQLPPLAAKSLDSLIKAIRRTGAEITILISPTMNSERFYPKAKSDVSVLDFSNLTEWPALFASEHRFNSGHLNSAGAAIYTRALAGSYILLKNPER
jgi:hypothetical protein